MCRADADGQAVTLNLLESKMQDRMIGAYSGAPLYPGVSQNQQCAAEPRPDTVTAYLSEANCGLDSLFGSIADLEKSLGAVLKPDGGLAGSMSPQESNEPPAVAHARGVSERIALAVTAVRVLSLRLAI